MVMTLTSPSLAIFFLSVGGRGGRGFDGAGAGVGVVDGPRKSPIRSRTDMKKRRSVQRVLTSVRVQL